MQEARTLHPKPTQNNYHWENKKPNPVGTDVCGTLIKNNI